MVTVLLAICPPIQAHPHAWIDLRVSVEFNADGGVAQMHQEWLLDPSYSLLLLDDWERTYPGHSLNSALQHLGHQLLGQLRAYDYFTELHLGEIPITIPEAIVGSLSLHHDRLQLRFSLALELPRPHVGTDLEYRIFDPSYWIEILHDPEDVIHLAGGLGCQTRIEAPQPTPGLVLYAATLDREQRAPVPDLGRAFAQTVRITCLL